MGFFSTEPSPLLIRLYDRTQLIGLEADSPDLEKLWCFTEVLNLVGSRPMKRDKDNMLSDLTEADKASRLIKPEDLRDVPIMNIPDESILSSVSVLEALGKHWSFPASTVSAVIPLNPESVLGRFYSITKDELLNNRDVSRRLFRYDDLASEVARAIYNEDLAKKVFKKSEA